MPIDAEVQEAINQQVDTMMVEFLSALVAVGVTQAQVEKAINLMMEKAVDDNA